jgi:hypothetical protein
VFVEVILFLITEQMLKDVRSCRRVQGAIVVSAAVVHRTGGTPFVTATRTINDEVVSTLGDVLEVFVNRA